MSEMLPATMPAGGLTTAEKIGQTIALFQTVDPATMPDDAREMAAGIQVLAGLGVDLFAMLIPADPADLDVSIDKMIGLLISLRGDDLPPFDLTLYGDAGE